MVMEKVFFVLKQAYYVSHIPVRYLSCDGKLTLCSHGYEQTTDPILHDNVLLENLATLAIPKNYPILEIENSLFLYGVFRDDINNIVLFGPISTETVDVKMLTTYKELHGINNTDFTIKKRSMSHFAAILALSYHAITGRLVTETQLLFQNDYCGPNIEQYQSASQLYLLDNTEKEIIRFSFSDEREFMRPITEGKPENIISRIDNLGQERVGKQALHPYKHHEYNCCSTITLSSRAAIQGGLEPMISYALADLFKQHLEKCTNIKQIIRLQLDIMVTFAEKVKQVHESRQQNNYVEQCKNYIANHLNTHFSLNDIAEKVGINQSYLSRRFSELEGIGIQRYTQQKRIEAAANMLKFSNATLSNIANYLCFPSQSYFGKVFKLHFGITPQKYRAKEKLTEFY